MYQRIIVAVDGSDPARRAAREAIALAADQAASLRFVYVVEMPYPYDAAVDFEAVAAPQRGPGEATLAEVAGWAREAGVEPETALASTYGGPVGDALVEDAERWRADLIVMGTRGRGGLLGKLLGSVAEGVVRAAPVPVMLLRGA